MLLYNFGIFLLNMVFKIASPFNPRAKKWIDSRKGLMKALKVDFQQVPSNCIWFHCASLGEFEQGRPLIESLNKDGHKLILSFYSPSGYEIRKDYNKVEHVFYLPLDTKSNAKRLLEIIQPKALFVVKYDLWYQILNETFQRGIPMFLVSATFKKHFSFFKFYGGTQRKMLRFFKNIFVQDHASLELLESINLKAQVAGDTRVDRVLTISEKAQKIETVGAFVGDHKCLVAGSTWPADESLLAELLKTSAFDDWKLIIAPHEIAVDHIQDIEEKFKNESINFSNIESSKTSPRVLIIDNIGLLSKLYQYADIAYIGGGFGAGIHNSLEPAAFGVPLIFGPKYENFMEAVKLVEKKGALPIHDYKDLENAFSKLQNKAEYSKAQQEIVNYLNQNKGATQLILNQTKPYLN